MWKYDCVVSVLYLGESVPPQYPPCQVEPGAETKIYIQTCKQCLTINVVQLDFSNQMPTTSDSVLQMSISVSAGHMPISNSK